MADDLSIVQQRPASMARMFLDRVAATPQAESFRYPVSGGWQSTTWQQTGDRVRALAAGLISLGVAAEERVAIISTTRHDWVLADFAVMCAGAATTTVYPTTPADDVAFILADSGSRFAFAENDTQIEKLREYREKLPELEQVVTFDGTADDDWVISFAELERRGREHLSTLPDVVDTAVDAIEPENLATLIYTSGTTGRPKGVRLVHDNWTYEGKAIEALDLLRPNDVQYLWLPLSHSFGKVLLSGQLAIGFASAVDGDITKLVEQLGVVRPTFMAGAPRIFEKVQHRVTSMVEEEGGAKAKIFHWAYGVGRQVSALQRAGKSVSPVLKVQHAIADRLVFSKLRGRFGGQVRYFVSGSAALSDKVAEFFHAAGILILEGYGLTETSAASFVNRPHDYKFGTVGWPLPGTQVRVADDGEILVRGPGVMRGYHNLPRETEETLTDDGWFRTGDIGELDDQGFLCITDRKKDLIKTSGGKYVAPQAIEVMFKALCPYASAIVVHGDGRNYVSALIALDPEAIEKWAELNGAAGSSYEDLSQRDDVRAMLQGYVDEMNGRLPRWETIKKFAVLPEDLTVESGDLTPSLKVKRKVVEKKYAAVLDGFYEEPAQAQR
ncbi:MAG TPA: long-chain fatty acid--CoA ligase [Acidothermales bacterium]